MSTVRLSRSRLANVCDFLLRYFARTVKPPSNVTIAQAMHLSPETAEAAVGMIEERSNIYRDPATREILAAYPFSARPTDHIVRFPDGHFVYSMCAIDALGMPTMLGADATIQSRCAY
jgi:alkylmercury lyase-like protein